MQSPEDRQLSAVEEDSQGPNPLLSRNKDLRDNYTGLGKRGVDDVPFTETSPAKQPRLDSCALEGSGNEVSVSCDVEREYSEIMII